MTDEKKLPARRVETPPSISETPGYLTTPAAQGGWLGRTIGRLVHGHRARTVRAATDEAQAVRDNLEAHEEVYRQAMRTAAAADSFHYDTPRIIANNRANTDHFMTQEDLRRQIETEDSRQTLAGIRSRGRRSAMQSDYDDQIAVANNEEKLADARMRALRAQWGHDAFRQTLPLRRERIEHLYKSGALDAELDRIVSEGERDAQLRHGTRGGANDGADTERTVLEQTLAELNLEIENARATHASDEVLAALHSFRAKVSARLKR